MGNNLVIRKLADRSGDCLEDGSWPLAGVEIVGDAPDELHMSQSYALSAREEGWLNMVNPMTVYRPAAPFDDPTSTPPHVFIHCDFIELRTGGDGVLRYKVVHQPDKYADHAGATDETPVTDEAYANGDTRVDYFYKLELEG